jgi:hypothetical protein
MKKFFRSLFAPKTLVRARTCDAVNVGVYSQIINWFTPAGSPTTKGQVSSAVIIATVAAGLSTTGTTQTGATPITAVLNEFSTVGSSGGASLLPLAAAGMIIYVDNIGGSNSMNVFPASGQTINGGSANAAFAVANAKRCIFYCVVAGNWKTLLTA